MPCTCPPRALLGTWWGSWGRAQGPGTGQDWACGLLLGLPLSACPRSREAQFCPRGGGCAETKTHPSLQGCFLPPRGSAPTSALPGDPGQLQLLTVVGHLSRCTDLEPRSPFSRRGDGNASPPAQDGQRAGLGSAESWRGLFVPETPSPIEVPEIPSLFLAPYFVPRHQRPRPSQARHLAAVASAPTCTRGEWSMQRLV